MRKDVSRAAGSYKWEFLCGSVESGAIEGFGGFDHEIGYLLRLGKHSDMAGGESQGRRSHPLCRAYLLLR